MHWCKAGDTVVVERPTYDRTLLSLRGRGADVRMVELETDGIDVAALERVLVSGLEPKLAHIIPNFQNPAGYTLSAASGSACSSSPASTDSRSSRTIPMWPCVSRASRCPRCSPWMVRPWSTPPRSRRRSARDPRGLSGRARGGDRRGDEDRHRHLHLAQHGLAGHREPVLSLGGARALDRDGQGGAARARSVLCTRSPRELPDARFVAPQGGYFLWVDLPERHGRRRALRRRGRRGVQFVKGSDFVLEGGEVTCGWPTRA